MSEKQPMMEGMTTFYPFAYLRRAAKNAQENAKTHRLGAGLDCISAVLFSALMTEAYLNHIGEILFPHWRDLERQLSWLNKITLIAYELKFDPDYGRRPFQTLTELFKFRDQLVHGKTQSFPLEYPAGDFVERAKRANPKWLATYSTEEAMDRAVVDTVEVMELIHAKAGQGVESLHVQSMTEAGEARQD